MKAWSFNVHRIKFRFNGSNNYPMISKFVQNFDIIGIIIMQNIKFDDPIFILIIGLKFDLIGVITSSIP